MQPLEQAIERGKSGAPVKNAVKTGTHLAAAPGSGFGAIRLAIGVEPPDQLAYSLLGGTVQVGEGVELVTSRSACAQHSACRPTTNWPASSLTMTAFCRNPCAVTAPQSAPSVAMHTGSGVTCSSLMPRR